MIEIKKISDLLFYDLSSRNKALLETGLNEYLFLLSAAQQAFTSLNKKKFSFFDPVVGENACQIRALWFALNAINYIDTIKKLDPLIAKAEQCVKLLLANIDSLKQKKYTLKELLDQEEGIQVELAMNEYYLLQFYLLTIGRTVLPPKETAPLLRNEVATPEGFMHLGNVTRRFGDNLIKHLRKTFSKMSVEFMRNLALNSESEEMVSEKFTAITGDPIRFHIPYFWSFKIFTSVALQYQIPLIIRSVQQAKDQGFQTIRKTTLFFRSTCGLKYKPCNPNSTDHDKMAIIIEGTMCKNYNELPNLENWQSELLNKSVIDLILAYGAAHRQYLDEKKDSLIEQLNNQQYQYYKKNGLEWGVLFRESPIFFH